MREFYIVGTLWSSVSITYYGFDVIYFKSLFVVIPVREQHVKVQSGARGFRWKISAGLIGWQNAESEQCHG